MSCRSMRKWQKCHHSRGRRWFWLVHRVWVDAAWKTDWWSSNPPVLAQLYHVHPAWFLSAFLNCVTPLHRKFYKCPIKTFDLISSVVDTSRRPRDDELDGNSYHFTSRTEMEVDVKAGHFLEHGEYDGNLYGTKIESIHEVVATGRTCILDVNPQVRDVSGQ